MFMPFFIFRWSGLCWMGLQVKHISPCFSNSQGLYSRPTIGVLERFVWQRDVPSRHRHNNLSVAAVALGKGVKQTRLPCNHLSDTTLGRIAASMNSFIAAKLIQLHFRVISPRNIAPSFKGGFLRFNLSRAYFFNVILVVSYT